MRPEDILEGKNRPFTGEEFLQSIKDGREIYINGERVEDVTKHPAFRNSAATVASLYDALHDPETKDKLCWETDTGNGGYTHKFFRYARSPEELLEQRDAIDRPVCGVKSPSQQDLCREGAYRPECPNKRRSRSKKTIMQSGSKRPTRDLPDLHLIGIYRDS